MKTIRPSPAPSKSHAKELEKKVRFMVEQISKLYKNQVLKELNKSTIQKFEDAQTGNYASVAMTLSKSVKAKILKRFGNKRIKTMTREILNKVNGQNQRVLYSNAEDVVGIPTVRMIREEGLTPEINALMIETEEWIKKLRDDHLVSINNNTLRMMTEGRNLSDIIKELGLNTKKAAEKAQLVATQQVTSFNGLSSKLRYQKLGIKKGVWVTSGDEKVRDSHRQRDGKEFDLSTGLYSSLDGKHLFPGTDFRCRCTMKAVIEE